MQELDWIIDLQERLKSLFVAYKKLDITQL